ncbi:MAG: OmpH family outer membrane protein [Nitrospirae bacterium]|nr:OmpH family outer membrane protein [Nitrospirota bacterium]
MKLIARTTALALVIFPALAASADAKDIKIGYVDLQQILFNSERGKQAKEALSSEYEERKTLLKKHYDEIQQMEEDIQSKGSLLSEDAKKKKEEAYWDKRRDFQSQTEKHETELRKKDMELTQKILVEVQALLQDLAKKKGYTLVIEKNEGAVLYAADSEDLTKDVLGVYDAAGKKPKK